ncbi:Cof-type HAD-IIB family hydrolase [Nocardioides sp. Root151]|uniref:Cof-type HAD-IIB family hydrolase n=1 Tax=Nocardioides sp. Root151 TaxID=1736475 RepID=UPI000702A86E|nr:Cof-type HAD-IIB family hydrolase [Nocardioides sp. Root151]KQZ76096.1 haloacid dehalogenase [Nocardioides sp. Root151]
MTPRLVATDLDGTLLDPDGKVSDRTREVLLAVEALGVPVVFVTGRPIRWMDELWTDVGGHGLAICSNGGIVYDVATHTVRNALTVPRDTALAVANTLRKAVPGTFFALEKTGGFAREEGFMGRHREPLGIPTGPLESIFDDTVVKLLAIHHEIGPETYWRRAEELVGTQLEVTWSSSFSLLEMSARGVTKATTLARLCDELSIDAADVVAFGDMPNDVPMLEWAGTSYAMENAHPAVRRVADHVAPGNADDGVATTLARLFAL